ncbi:hypothetical protein E2C01_047637 [Portunus trituberculatus]|uniref:Uncharacterized protein n=1 Tax=Portunus trituberculatus TaxID=210409 RepID=A0A5B7G801_PORTR|nr:hypothetical protein [Portunus trituberculatus]
MPCREHRHSPAVCRVPPHARPPPHHIWFFHAGSRALLARRLGANKSRLSRRRKTYVAARKSVPHLFMLSNSASLSLNTEASVRVRQASGSREAPTCGGHSTHPPRSSSESSSRGPRRLTFSSSSVLDLVTVLTPRPSYNHRVPPLQSAQPPQAPPTVLTPLLSSLRNLSFSNFLGFVFPPAMLLFSHNKTQNISFLFVTNV